MVRNESIEERATEPSDTSDIKLAYLTYREVEDEKGKGYHGGILVIDPQGRPLEFRCTNVVRPTNVQRTLYGRNLLPFLLEELFGVPLIQALVERPSVVLVDDERLLEVRRRVDSPVIFISRQAEMLELRDTESEGSLSHAALLEAPSGRFQAVIFDSHPLHPEERDKWRSQLQPIFGRVDLPEPFERVKRALEDIVERGDWER